MKFVKNGKDAICSKCGKTIEAGEGYYAYPKGIVFQDCNNKK